ncbi:MAG TPA: hypothetical protein VGH44_05295 [Candidatus Saccharimonadia bacterium]
MSQKISRLAGAAAIVMGLMLPMSASAAESQNCDANAVIWCGATTVSTLQSRYAHGDGHNSASSIQHIYAWFGITSGAINGMSSDAQNGTVTKSGDVFVGNQLVATGAVTGGRQNIAGSTQESWGGTTFFARKPSVSFLDNSLSAFVVMKNGQFQFAVMKSCGNAVKATPMSKPSPSPTPSATPTLTPIPTETATPLPSATPEEHEVVPTQTPQVLSETTPTLVQTGPATALGGAAGLAGITYAGRAYLRSKKSLLGALRKRDRQ